MREIFHLQDSYDGGKASMLFTVSATQFSIFDCYKAATSMYRPLIINSTDWQTQTAIPFPKRLRYCPNYLVLSFFISVVSMSLLQRAKTMLRSASDNVSLATEEDRNVNLRAFRYGVQRVFKLLQSSPAPPQTEPVLRHEFSANETVLGQAERGEIQVLQVGNIGRVLTATALSPPPVVPIGSEEVSNGIRRAPDTKPTELATSLMDNQKEKVTNGEALPPQKSGTGKAPAGVESASTNEHLTKNSKSNPGESTESPQKPVAEFVWPSFPNALHIPSERSRIEQKYFPARLEAEDPLAIEFSNVVLPALLTLFQISLRPDLTQSISVDLVIEENSMRPCRPTILITCSHSKRLIEKKVNETNTITQDTRTRFNVQVACGKLRLSAGNSSHMGDDQTKDEEDARVYEFNEFPCGLPVQAFFRSDETVKFENATKLGIAILGGIVYIGSRPYGLTVHHVFQPPSPHQKPGSSLSRGASADVDTIHEDTIHEVLRVNSDESGIYYIELVDPYELKGMNPTTSLYLPERLRKIASSRIRPRTQEMDKPTKNMAPSFLVDWALVELRNLETSSNVYCAENGSYVTVGEYLEVPIGSRMVKVISKGRIKLAGQTAAVPSLLSVDGHSFGLAYVVMFDEPLENGLSGSWIVDSESGKLCGYLYATSTALPWAYFLSISETFQDIKTTLGTSSVTLLPSDRGTKFTPLPKRSPTLQADLVVEREPFAPQEVHHEAQSTTNILDLVSEEYSNPRIIELPPPHIIHSVTEKFHDPLNRPRTYENATTPTRIFKALKAKTTVSKALHDMAAVHLFRYTPSSTSWMIMRPEMLRTSHFWVGAVIVVLDMALIIAAGFVAAYTGAARANESNLSNITMTLLLRRATFVSFVVALLLKVLWGLQWVAEQRVYKTAPLYTSIGSLFFGFGIVVGGSSAAIALLNVGKGQLSSVHWVAMTAASVPLYFALNLMLGSTVLGADFLCAEYHRTLPERFIWRLCGVGAASLAGFTYAKVAQDKGLQLCSPTTGAITGATAGATIFGGVFIFHFFVLYYSHFVRGFPFRAYLSRLVLSLFIEETS